MAKNIIRRLNINLARRLREARRETGLSTRAVAAKLPRPFAISHATLTSYENGTTAPPIDVLGALAAFYRRPLQWFLEDGDTFGPFRYRNLRSRVPLSVRRQFEAVAAKWAEAYLRLDRFLRPDQPRPPEIVDPEEPLSPEKLAAHVRKRHLNLDDTQPIQNMIGVLEHFSARALEIETPFSTDGAATQMGNDFVVIVNPEVSNERIRLNAAHELAHVLYRESKEWAGWTDEDVEKLAYRFASEILLPESQLAEAFKDQSFLKMMEFKEKFGVSLVAMIYVAEQSRIINSSVARRLWSEVSRRGWRQKEPGYVWRDRAIGFEMLLEKAIGPKTLSWTDAVRVTAIREVELRRRLDNALGNATAPPSNKEQDRPPTINFMDAAAARNGASEREKGRPSP